MNVRPDLLIVYFVCLGIVLIYIPWHKWIPAAKVIEKPLIKCKMENRTLFSKNISIGTNSIYGLISAENEPLIGANVIIENTTISTISDIDGEFSIEAPDHDANLIISYTGYRSCRCKTEGQKSLNIKMSQSR